jgi:dihydroorotase-like cyclic amidohydrolase
VHDVILHGGLVVTSSGERHASVAIDGETVTAVAPASELGKARRVVDVNGRILLPGLIDPHVHFGTAEVDDDDTMREDFRHDSRDWVLGGVTTVATTTLIGPVPLTDLLTRAIRCAEGHSTCDYRFTTCVTTREQIDDIPAVVSRGSLSFKFFPGYSGEQALDFGMNPDGVPPDLFMDACHAIRSASPAAFAAIHAEEPTIRGILMDRIRSEPGAANLVSWAQTSPGWAESIQVYAFALIAGAQGVGLYPVHISSAETASTVRTLKRERVPIVGETLCAYLCTTAEELDSLGVGSKAKIQPPIRHSANREALWAAVQDGTIDIVGTDSNTYSASYKESADFWDCRVGINQQGADMLPLLWNEGVVKGRISAPRLSQITSENAAKRFGLYPRKGTIAPGSDADIVVLDPEREATLGVERYRGKTDYSIWQGRRVTGVPSMTLLRGAIVAENGELVDDRPRGRYLADVPES